MRYLFCTFFDGNKKIDQRSIHHLHSFLANLYATLFFGMITLPKGVDVMWIMTLGTGGLMAHFCITNALSIAPAIVVIPLDFMRLPLISVIGFLAYGEAFELPILIGASVILVAILVNLEAEQQRQ